MTDTTKSRIVRRADAVNPHKGQLSKGSLEDRARRLDRIVAIYADAGIPPEESTLLLRRIEREYDDEDVSAYVDENGHVLSGRIGAFVGYHPWLRWGDELERLAQERATDTPEEVTQ